MKKNLLIVFLAIVSVASLVFSYTQMQKAEKQEALAKTYAEKFEEHQRIIKEITSDLQKEKELIKRKAELAEKNYSEATKLALEHTKKRVKEFEEEQK